MNRIFLCLFLCILICEHLRNLRITPVFLFSFCLSFSVPLWLWRSGWLMLVFVAAQQVGAAIIVCGRRAGERVQQVAEDAQGRPQ